MILTKISKVLKLNEIVVNYSINKLYYDTLFFNKILNFYLLKMITFFIEETFY